MNPTSFTADLLIVVTENGGPIAPPRPPGAPGLSPGLPNPALFQAAALRLANATFLAACAPSHLTLLLVAHAALGVPLPAPLLPELPLRDVWWGRWVGLGAIVGAAEPPPPDTLVSLRPGAARSRRRRPARHRLSTPLTALRLR